jgi:large subunit ribosomal protein L23
MRDARSVIVRPIVSEKSYAMVAVNKYTFEVDKSATKQDVARAVEEIFDVSVTKVNTMNVQGKPRRLRFNSGKTRSWKKAVVTVKEGDTIEVFGAQ